MTRLRIATWNVHEGTPVDGAMPADTSAFWAPLIDAEADVVALQEVFLPASGELGDLATTAKLAGLPHVVFSPLSASSSRAGELSGLALLSRYPLRDEEQVKLPNPELGYERNGTVMNSHDKGLLSAVLDLKGSSVSVRVVSLHVTPFHRFGRAPQEFGSIWAALAKSIGALDDLPLLIAGDFNTGHRALLTEQLDGRLHRAIGDQKTHDDKASDDILYTDAFELLSTEVIDTQSDHALCLAEFERPSDP